MLKSISLIFTVCLTSAASLALAGTEAGSEKPAGVRETAPLGETVEKQFDPDAPVKLWSQDASIYEKNRGDRIETQQVLEKEVKTIKLHNVVPPIRYATGDYEIPESYVGQLREILGRMKDRHNVRLHFVGHSDNVRLIGALKARLGDNVGLSRERAGTAAEFFQRALDLPPESISYEGLGKANPVASNATAAGKAENRRVEVEVWYDELGGQAGREAGRGHREAQPHQGVPRREGVQADLQGRQLQACAGQEPGAAVALRRGFDRVAGIVQEPHPAGARQPVQQAERGGQADRP
jgi:outer membrane protein OmpA-like peptidoglycan-associated protein